MFPIKSLQKVEYLLKKNLVTILESGGNLKKNVI